MKIIFSYFICWHLILRNNNNINLNAKVSPYFGIVFTEGVFWFMLQELHKNIVNQYKKHYKLNMPIPSQEDCMYWYNFLAYHMAGANMQKVSSDWVFVSFLDSPTSLPYACPSCPGHFFPLKPLCSQAFVQIYKQWMQGSLGCPLIIIVYYYVNYFISTLCLFVFSTSSWEYFLKQFVFFSFFFLFLVKSSLNFSENPGSLHCMIKVNRFI